MTKDIFDEINLESPVFVPNGEYQVVLKDWKKFWHFRRSDLVMWFEILDQGDYYGELLPAYYRVTWNGEKIAAGWKSHFCRDYQRCFGPVACLDQFTISSFENVLFLAEIREVISDQDGQPLGEVNQYSRIGRLIRVLPSLDSCDR